MSEMSSRDRCRLEDVQAHQIDALDALQVAILRMRKQARTDEDGYTWVMGRSKDVVISGGENIYPAELENVLADCPQIAEAAVIGIEDPKWGEAACAVVVRKGDIDEHGVLDLFQNRLAKFKHPRRVVFVDSLPKNAMGKVQKFQLKRLISSR